MSGLAREEITLEGLLQDAINKNLLDLHTCLPAKVDSYDNSNQTCTVTPLLKRKLKDGTEYTLPAISDVPVAFYRSGKAFISLPIQAGDTGFILFSERSMDLWLSSTDSAKEVCPNDIRKFDLSDAIFYPGLSATSDSVTSSADSILIENDAGKIKIENGKVAIGTASTELLSEISDLAQEASDLSSQVSTLATLDAAHIHSCAVGPTSPPLTAAAITAVQVAVDAIKARIDATKGKVDSIKGSF